jgi:hypothetical protein
LCTFVYPGTVSARRLNISLDEQRGSKLARLADRAHVQDGTLARSLLSAAIDDADPAATTVTEILEGIPGMSGRLEAAEMQVSEGATIELDELAS